MNDKTVKKNFIIYLLKTLVTTFTPLVQFAIASRALGVTSIGRVQYAQSIVGYFQLIAGLGITAYAIREGARCRDDKYALGKLTSELLLINLASTALAYLAFFVTIALVKPLHGYIPLLLVWCVSMLFNTIGIEWYYNVVEEYTYITVRTIIFNLLSIVCVFLLVHTPEDYMSYAAILVVPTALANLVNFVHARKSVKLFGYKGYSFKNHIKPILLVFGIGIAGNIYLQLDITMLGAMVGDDEVGLYSVASKVSKMVVTVLTAICAVFLPRLSYYLAHDDRKKFYEILRYACNIIISLSLPAAVGMLLLSPEIVILFSGAEFLQAVPATRVLSFNVLMSAVNGFLCWQILMPIGRERFILLSSASGAVIDFILNLLLVPRCGALGAAVATLAAEVCVFIVTLIVLYISGIELKTLYSHLWQYIVAVLPFFAVRYGVSSLVLNAWLSTALTVAVCACIYLVILLLLKNPYVVELLADLKRLVKSRLKRSLR